MNSVAHTGTYGEFLPVTEPRLDAICLLPIDLFLRGPEVHGGVGGTRESRRLSSAVDSQATLNDHVRFR